MEWLEYIPAIVNKILEWAEFVYDWLDYYKEHKPD